MSTKNKPNLTPTTDIVPNSIPIEWMIRWTSEQKDPGKAAVVKELISSFVMHNAFPSLALQLDEMQGNCNPVKQDERNTKSIAETIKDKEIPFNIEQMNLGNGTQSFLEKPINKYLTPKTTKANDKTTKTRLCRKIAQQLQCDNPPV